MIDLVAGARPNFVKLAPVLRALRAEARAGARIVHTGQHYDVRMNDVFFAGLGIPEPDVQLGVGSGSHGAQTARILERYEAHLMETRPEATVVFGDVNSTVACALAAVKLGIPVAHVEAGLRSRDRTMPEEINRLLTDAIAGLLLVSEPSGVENLRREGVDGAQILLVGNVMIDTLVRELGPARSSGMPARFGLAGSRYGLVTLHRPSNVDRPEILEALLRLLQELSRELPLVLPLHPRTLAAARAAGLEALLGASEAFRVIDPLPYRENLGLMASASVVLTDSGGMQEETSWLRIPCLTLRENTERPITVEQGTSVLVGNDPARIRAAFADALAGRWPKGGEIPFWDGRAGERIASALAAFVRR